ncbi:MAG TPA: HTTM domain-containing protein [Kofleriaceae bacterium]|nr:HTTM domain-containing protein [Kofleriaceae bacterium]
MLSPVTDDARLASSPSAGLGRRIGARAGQPVDIASLAALRIIFGLVMFGGIVRFLFTGWIEAMYGQPRFFFHYPGFDWVEAWSVTGMYVHYGVLAGLALAIAAGAWHRVVTPLFVVGFAYTQLIDVTNYLNHHYLVVVLGGLLAVLPAHRAWSIDAWRDPSLRASTVPAWVVWLLRFQIGVVYVFAGLAKMQSDWLVHAQPLNVWMSARSDTPVIGPWLDERWLAYAMSWGGFLFDTTIVVWLSWRRTRLPAFVALAGFHAATGYFFNIGMFPLIMTTSALVFFAPSWPRRFVRGFARGADRETAPTAYVGGGRVLRALLVAHVIVQIALPLRHHLYPGAVAWNEDGMRFAWQVMVREKHGSITFVVRFPDGRRLEVPPHRYLTARQEREMAGQPDLILQLARHIERELRAAGHGDVAVHADTRVSLNGRAPAPLLDPDVDLTRVTDLGPRDWVRPAPSSDPIHLRARR